MEKTCLACKTKRPRRLRPGVEYAYAKTVPTFCSLKCAAAFGLLAANGQAGGGVREWCRKHGWYSYHEGDPAGDECPDCYTEEAGLYRY
jgi:hypothetical protein